MQPTMRRLLRTHILVAALAASLVPAPPAGAATAVAPNHGFAPGRLLVKFEGQHLGRAISVPPGAGVRRTAKALRQNPRVVYAEPDYVATASAIRATPFDPNDPGTIGAPFEPSSLPDGWASKQWNFLASEGPATSRLPTSPGGIDAVGAWRHLIEAGRPGAEGIVVAVLDSGIAYRPFDGIPRSPDFSSSQFVPGYDFIGHDRFPVDKNGHGTHVAGTIAEQTDNGIGLTGLAYRAKLMPVRVLNREGEGLESQIARGIRFAVTHHANVINMSFNFECQARLPMVNEALRFAYRRGVVTVASGGNLEPPKPGKAKAKQCVSAPATGPHVIGVGGTTEGACMGYYSLAGAAIDLVAPGGGEPRQGCPSILQRPIYQVTFRPKTTEFGIPDNYIGTSMAAAHVSGVAAMVLASGVLGPQPTPEAKVKAVRRQLRRTARDLGYPRSLQGAGLIDAAKATEPLGL
ncbi:MAG: S8 family serine peptidase [Solirubrobacterales bacterium]